MIKVYLDNNQNNLKYLYKHYSEYEIQTIDYEQSSIMYLLKQLSTTSLLEIPKLYIVINSKFLVTKSDKLNKKSEEVFHDILNVKTNNKLVFLINKPLNKNISYIADNISKIKYIENLDQTQEKNFLKEEKITIKSKTLNYLKENISEDYEYQSELIKLNLYKDGEEILQEDIDKFVKQKESVNIFNFVENIILGKYERAYTYYINILTKEELAQPQILAIMHQQLKFYIQVKIFQQKGYLENQITSHLKASPYRVKSSLNVVNKTSLENLILIQRKIAKYDYLIKSGKTKEESIIINFLIKE